MELRTNGARDGHGDLQVDLSLDRPRSIDQGRSGPDLIFQSVVRLIAAVVLVIFGSIGIFLGLKLIPTFRHYGFGFFTKGSWNSRGIPLAATLLGTAEVAIVALIIAFPLALATAIYISEYAPVRIKGTLVAAVDLMAAVPSIIYGLWGALLLQPHAKFIARWLDQYLGWVPFFRVNADPNSATWSEIRFVGSPFIAGICVSMMVLPIACAVMRGVFASAPAGEREAAYALGATKASMIRAVVLPFGRGGIIGGTMLGLGRALGETIAVLLIISFSSGMSIRVLQSGTSTISSLIANNFGDASALQLSALLSAGFVLFLITLAVNTVAAIFVSRSRSGSATEI
jgi:phosphate transport system permease protein